MHHPRQNLPKIELGRSVCVRVFIRTFLTIFQFYCEICYSNSGEIILYQPDSSIRLKVRMEEETVWLNRKQMATLFNRDKKTIGKHVNNALKEELAGFPVVAKFATTADDGKNYQTEYYNLDMPSIIVFSV